MKSLILLFLLIGFTPIFSYAQEGEIGESQEETGLKKNSIFGNIGILPPILAGAASVSYDRSIFIAKDHTDIRAKLSAGYMGVWGGSVNYQSITIGMIAGGDNHHFELYGGGALTQSNDSKDPGQDHSTEISKFRVFPAGNIGYRYQKPDGWFVFRAGAGFPDLGYVGVGVAF